MKKLSKRLNAIHEMVPKNTKVLWDTCCDHGMLGKSFLGSGIHVNFVDVVDHIVKSLEKELIETDLTNYTCHVQDLGDIEIINSADETIVIAGVGGWTGIEGIQSILSRNNSLLSTFIVSVQKNIDHFTQFMKEQNFNLIEQRVVEDRGKEYTIFKYGRD